MSTYYSIGCEKCREQQSLVSDGGGGFNWMGGATEEALPFLKKHIRLGCESQLRVFSEHDWRYDEFADFDPAVEWDV